MDNSSTGYGWDSSMKICLRDKIRQDMKTAMINKDVLVKDTMRLIIGAFPDLTVPITLENGKKSTRPKKLDEITDEDIQDIIRKFIKSEKTVLELKKQESSPYLELLTAYLPQMATEAQITAWIGENIDFSSLKSPMQAMGPIMKHFGKLADGNLVRQILAGMDNPHGTC